MSMKVGVSGVVYAKVLSDDATGTKYGPIKPIPGAVSIDNKTASSIDTFYADNGPYEVAGSLGEITLDMEMADPTPETIADLLGHTVTAGVVDFSGDDIAPDVAIGFVGLKGNGKKRLVWLRKGQFQEPDDNYKTKGSKSDPQSQKLTGKFVLLKSNRKWKKTVDEDAVGVLPATLTSWFTVDAINVTMPAQV